jgi:hypothetical protein
VLLLLLLPNLCRCRHVLGGVLLQCAAFLLPFPTAMPKLLPLPLLRRRMLMLPLPLLVPLLLSQLLAAPAALLFAVLCSVPINS